MNLLKKLTYMQVFIININLTLVLLLLLLLMFNMTRTVTRNIGYMNCIVIAVRQQY